MKNILAIFGALCVSSSAFALTGQISFTPTGFKFPIMKITMAKNSGFTADTHLPIPSNDQVLYKCASATETGCLVDLTSQTELDKVSAAAQGVSVAQGTYDMLTLTSCADGKGGSSQVSIWLKGYFGAGASPTYYYTDYPSANGVTAASPNSSATASTLANFTEITNWGCSSKVILLATPIVIGTAATPTPTPTSSASPSPLPSVALDQTLTVLVDNTNLGNSTPATSSGMGGCKVEGNGGTRGICVNIPALLPYVGSATTTTKRFLISHSNVGDSSIVNNKANAQIIVPMAGTTALTVFAGPYYSETSVEGGANVTSTALLNNFQGPTYNTSTDVSTFVDNGDATISFKQGGSADSNGGVFVNFPLAGGAGTLTSRDATATWYYHAILQ